MPFIEPNNPGPPRGLHTGESRHTGTSPRQVRSIRRSSSGSAVTPASRGSGCVSLHPPATARRAPGTEEPVLVQPAEETKSRLQPECAQKKKKKTTNPKSCETFPRFRCCRSIFTAARPLLAPSSQGCESDLPGKCDRPPEIDTSAVIPPPKKDLLRDCELKVENQQVRASTGCYKTQGAGKGMRSFSRRVLGVQALPRQRCYILMQKALRSRGGSKH